MIQLSTDCSCCCALNFSADNTSEYAVSNPTTALETGLCSWGLEIWIRPDSYVDAAPPLSFSPIVNHSNISVVADPRVWSVGVMNTGGVYRIHVVLQEGSPNYYYTALDPILIDRSTWYHIVVNRNSIDPADIEVYINGRKQTAFAISGAGNTIPFQNPPITAPFTLNFGRFENGYGASYYAGDMAQFRFYKRPITQAEAVFNHKHGFYRPATMRGLTFWVPFNSCFSNECTCISGAQLNTVTLFNFGARINQGGGAWIEDCPTCLDCEDRREIDHLQVGFNDSLVLPLPLEDGTHFTNPISRFTPYCQFNVQFPMVQIQSVSYMDFKWRLSNYPTLSGGRWSYDAGVAIDVVCDGVNTLHSDITIADYASIELFWEAITNLVPGKISVDDCVFTWTETTNVCNCDTSNNAVISVTASTLAELRDDYVFPAERRRNFYNPNCDPCDSSSKCYYVLRVYNLCIEITQDWNCVNDRHFKFTAPALDTPLIKPFDSLNCRWWVGFGKSQSNFCSQPAELGSLCDTVLMRWHNANQTPKVARVRALLNKGGYEKKQEISTSTRGVNRKLLSIVTPTYSFETDYLTQETHTQILQALESDVCEIEVNGVWVRVNCEDNYTIAWEEKPYPQKGKGTVTLKDYTYTYFNDFC